MFAICSQSYKNVHKKHFIFDLIYDIIYFGDLGETAKK